MKTNLLLTAALLLGASLRLSAAPLAVTTAVHTKPDATSPALTYLKAGSEPMPAAGAVSAAPEGWMAIELPGPFEGYVENKDLTKSLDVKPGTSIRLAPKPEAGVLTVAQKEDRISITGLRGKWTQVSLEKKMLGYIKVGDRTPAAPAPVALAAPAAAPVAPSPASPAVYGVATPGQAAPMVNLGDGGSSALPRQFAGKFVSTRRALAPRRPYDYALNDENGRRYAYLDVSKLLQTEQIEKYVDRQVVVFGAGKSSADGKDIVIVVETLQLK
jgi:hypothetical protein